MIIGREAQFAELQGLLEKEESQFCAVYGRRRVGKTYLVREAFNGNFTFYHTGLANAGRDEQLAEFCVSLRKYGLKRCRIPKTWYEAFHRLEDLLENAPSGKKVVFIDELPWMETPKSNFMSALEHFWNSWASARTEKDIVLIVCGSATSWLINKVVRNYGGLHNRLTCQISLPPFTLRECEQFAEAMNLEMPRKEIAEAYMIMGGIPYYWSFLKRSESLDQNIDRLFFAEGSPLQFEFDVLYASLFRNPKPHLAIISALATKKAGMMRMEILAETKLSDNQLFTRSLEELVQCGFVRKYYAIGKKERNAVYQLIDNYTLFYYRYIRNNFAHNPNFWSHSRTTSMHAAWSGLAFERLCLLHVPQIKQKLGISGVATNVYSWRTTANEYHSGAQVDLVIDRNDSTINLCEMKFSDDIFALTKDEADKLQNRRTAFMLDTKTNKSVRITLVTTYGAVHNKYWKSVSSEIVLDDLFA